MNGSWYCASGMTLLLRVGFLIELFIIINLSAGKEFSACSYVNICQGNRLIKAALKISCFWSRWRHELLVLFWRGEWWTFWRRGVFVSLAALMNHNSCHWVWSLNLWRWEEKQERFTCHEFCSVCFHRLCGFLLAMAAKCGWYWTVFFVVLYATEWVQWILLYWTLL